MPQFRRPSCARVISEPPSGPTLTAWAQRALALILHQRRRHVPRLRTQSHTQEMDILLEDALAALRHVERAGNACRHQTRPRAR